MFVEGCHGYFGADLVDLRIGSGETEEKLKICTQRVPRQKWPVGYHGMLVRAGD